MNIKPIINQEIYSTVYNNFEMRQIFSLNKHIRKVNKTCEGVIVYDKIYHKLQIISFIVIEPSSTFLVLMICLFKVSKLSP